MRGWLSVWTGVAGLGAVAALFFSGAPLDRVVTALAGVGCLLWGLVVLTLPWDLHFQARKVLREVERSRARALDPQVDPTFLRTVATRTLIVALLGHAGSAVAVLGLAAWADWGPGRLVAAAYLVSATFRPIGAWYLHLRESLRTALVEATHPREDARALRQALTALELRVTQHADTLRSVEHAHGETRDLVRAESARADQRFDQLSRHFETSIERLTDDQELLAGLRAFLRLVRETPR